MGENKMRNFDDWQKRDSLLFEMILDLISNRFRLF